MMRLMSEPAFQEPGYQKQYGKAEQNPNYAGAGLKSASEFFKYVWGGRPKSVVPKNAGRTVEVKSVGANAGFVSRSRMKPSTRKNCDACEEPDRIVGDVSAYHCANLFVCVWLPSGKPRAFTASGMSFGSIDCDDCCVWFGCGVPALIYPSAIAKRPEQKNKAEENSSPHACGYQSSLKGCKSRLGPVHFGNFKTAIAEIQHRPNGADGDQSEIQVSNEGNACSHGFSWGALRAYVDLHCNSSPLSDLSSIKKSNNESVKKHKSHKSLLSYFYVDRKSRYQIAHESPFVLCFRAFVQSCFGVLYCLFCKKYYFTLDCAKSFVFCAANGKNYFARNLATLIFCMAADLINVIARWVIAIDGARLNFLRQIFAVRIFTFRQSKLDGNNFAARAALFPSNDRYSSKFEANRIAGGAQ
ncbi:hypothetical protein [Thalassospira xiamenensis]|uniref:hypothetical protein n=1 Tax=Thalassospira xiamenensis TaxID=220697 RepID=UPI001E40796B|nr:hypothetical protein [Thalassospira xiamenensis]MCD1593378.1 hypothetical protein [Thalassospira xiamenensis]